MPFVTVEDGTRISDALAGRRDGEPLLLIHGLGADTRGWVMQRRALAPRFRLVLVANRGVARSPPPAGPYHPPVTAPHPAPGATRRGLPVPREPQLRFLLNPIPRATDPPPAEFPHFRREDGGKRRAGKLETAKKA